MSDAAPKAPTYHQTEYEREYQAEYGHRCSSDNRRYGRFRSDLRRWLMRDRGGACEGCGWGSSTLVVHHVIPSADGGDDTPTNLLLLCGTCHQKRHDHPLSSRAKAGAP